MLDLVDDQLVEIDQRGEPPIENGAVLDRRVDERVSMKFQTYWWIADGTLYSSRSTESYAFRDMSQGVPDPYLADIWAWEREGEFLVPVAQDRECIGNGDQGPEPVACPDSGGDVPDVFPAVPDTIGVGESFEVDLDGGGADTVALEADSSRGDWLELVITTTYGGEQRLPIPYPAAYSPEVYTTPVNVGSWDSFALLVADGGGDSSSMSLVTMSAGELVAVEEQGDCRSVRSRATCRRRPGSGRARSSTQRVATRAGRSRAGRGPLHLGSWCWEPAAARRSPRPRSAGSAPVSSPSTATAVRRRPRGGLTG